ncbi:MAG: PD40 domain-containing protein [Gemmatimonadota bacterium]|nr:MAG: PD40 domain-containing protein [Gemmatimonadota bacterium]
MRGRERRAGAALGRRGAALLPALVPLAVATPLLAQEPPIEQGVRIGITYTPGLRPGMLVLASTYGERLDSVRAIVARDLEFSDRFEMISLPGGDSLLLGLTQISSGGDEAAGTAIPFVNYSLYAALGADYAVAVGPDADSARVRATLYDVRGETPRQVVRTDLPALDSPDFRMSAHRVADEMVRAATGEPGFAATRLLFIQDGRLQRVDADGADLGVISPPGITAFSPEWLPDAARVVYTELSDGRGRIVIHDLVTGDRRAVPPTADLLNYAAAVSPNGELLAFSRSGDEGTEVYRYNLARDCCLERLTVGRFSDNLSPTFSPDGRQIAYVSTRPGLPQIYVMAADGTGQELFAPFDYGVTGSSNAPEWSPDGTRLAFHRDVQGSLQVFIMDARSRAVRQLTSAGRNTDPTWAPDGRHLAFVSDRTGRRQIWVIDIETGRVRQLTTVGDARLPAWSPRITMPTEP